MSSEKVRIYDLARELGVPNKELMGKLKDNLKISVKSHSSTISGDVADKIRELISSEGKGPKSLSKMTSTPEPTTAPKPEPEVAKNLEQEAKPESEVAKDLEQEAKPEPEAAKNLEQEASPELTTRERSDTRQHTHTPKQNKPLTSPTLNQTRKPDYRRPDNPKMLSQRTEMGHKGIKTPYTPKRPTTTPNQQQTQTDKNKTSSLPDRPYGISGGKYRRKPQGKTITGQKPTSKFTGKKPQYFQKPGQEEIKETKSVEEKAETPINKEVTEEVKVQEVKITQESQTVQEPKHKPETKDHKPHQTTKEFPGRKDTREKPEIREKKEFKETREYKGNKEHREDKPGFKQEKQGFKQEKPGFKQDKQETKANESSKDQPKSGSQAKGSGKTVTKPGHKKEFLKKKDKYQDLKPLSEVFKRKKQPKREEIIIEKPTEIFIDNDLIIAELAEMLHISSAEIIKELMKSGIFATLNQTISKELARDVAEKLEYTVLSEAKEEHKIQKEEEPKEEKQKTVDRSNMIKRAPIVTILGHVDHGKTTLLDSIRASKHKLVDAEVGGITQSIGAYSVECGNERIVFIDTPGHHAFTAMRARGAKATDIAILIVAADDGIMPQTIEAINHAKAAKVPIIVAINKVDKAGVDPDKILHQLAEHNLIPEDWGGDTVTVKISALKGDGIDDLLEMITLVAELQELKASPNLPGTGVVIESELDKGKGSIARVLVQDGTLKIGDYVAVGSVGGKVRALLNDHGERIEKAGPSTPVEILGLSDVPSAGDIFDVIEDDKTLKQIVNKRKQEDREKRLGNQTPIKLQKDTMFKAKQKKSEAEIKELNIIIKADTDGSAKAVETALLELKSREIIVKIIHTGVGDISEADVMLAATSGSIIIGFGVKEDPNAAKVSAEENISIRTYDIIYQISEDIEKTMLGLLEPEFNEVELGTAEVRDLFTIGKNLVIAGCYVLNGKVVRNRIASVIRENKEIYRGNLDNLKRFKDDAKEVASGYECGISFNKFNDLQKGDLIKVTAMVEVERESLN